MLWALALSPTHTPPRYHHQMHLGKEFTSIFCHKRINIWKSKNGHFHLSIRTTSFAVKFFPEPEAVFFLKVITLAFLITELAAESIPKSTEEELPKTK